MSFIAKLNKRFGDNTPEKPAKDTTTIAVMLGWLMSQGEFSLRKYEGVFNGRIYAMLKLTNGTMKLRLESDTIQYEDGALEVVVTQLYERAKRAQMIYSV